jgi:hypothetical protein
MTSPEQVIHLWHNTVRLEVERFSTAPITDVDEVISNLTNTAQPADLLAQLIIEEYRQYADLMVESHPDFPNRLLQTWLPYPELVVRTAARVRTDIVDDYLLLGRITGQVSSRGEDIIRGYGAQLALLLRDDPTGERVITHVEQSEFQRAIRRKREPRYTSIAHGLVAESAKR